MSNSIFQFATSVANECGYSPHQYQIMDIYSFFIFLMRLNTNKLNLIKRNQTSSTNMKLSRWRQILILHKTRSEATSHDYVKNSKKDQVFRKTPIRHI
jgi:hypothetical protein